MAICKNCGVDLGEGDVKCPLCDTTESREKITSPADVLNLSKKENIRQLYELTMLLLFSGILITTAIDAVFGKGMSWSLFTTTCISYSMITITLFHFLKSRPYWFLGLYLISTSLLLFLIDIFSGNNGWFLSLAGPLSLSLFLLAGSVVFLNSLSKYRGLNLIATVLLALAIFVVCIEYFADRYFYGFFKPQWSVVTAASLTIIALILIFIHYRLKRGRSLGRLFHV